LTAKESLCVWIMDPTGWWGAEASERLNDYGHRVAVFGSVDELRASSAAGVTPDVIVYSCPSTTKYDLDAMARLTAGPWLVVVVISEIDVRMNCSIYECGVAAIGARYDPPAAIVGTIEDANRSKRRLQAAKAAWSVHV